jgi:hypothetical protein
MDYLPASRTKELDPEMPAESADESNKEINQRQANPEIETLEQASVDDLSESLTVDLNPEITTEATNDIFIGI